MNSRSLILFITFVSHCSLTAMGYEQSLLCFTDIPIQAISSHIVNNGILPTKLHRAVWLADIDTIRELINKRVPLNIQNDNGETPLHFASEIVNAKTRNKMYQLLVKAGADPHIPDYYLQKTAYDKICLRNKYDMHMNMSVKSFEHLSLEG